MEENRSGNRRSAGTKARLDRNSRGETAAEQPRNETKRNESSRILFSTFGGKNGGRESEREKGRGRKEEASLSSSLCERDAPLCSF